jgi:hypothetical protein
MKTKIYEDLASLFPLWRETTLEEKNHEKKEVDFVVSVFKKYPAAIRSVIDLGGGVGLHAGLLSGAGYEVTLFDQSRKALAIAKKNNPKLKIAHGSFESIGLKGEYDAAICMWSTLSYVLSEVGRRKFYAWQARHVKKLIILDEANFYRYPHNFHKVYVGEDEDHEMTVERDWVLSNQNLKKTKFIYEVFDKKTEKSKIIKDAENEQYLSVEQLKNYLGFSWNLKYLCGGYDLKNFYEKKKSSRIIPVFFKSVKKK